MESTQIEQAGMRNHKENKTKKQIRVRFEGTQLRVGRDAINITCEKVYT